MAPGELQLEIDHAMQSSNSKTDIFLDQFWRNASNGSYFSYRLETKGETDLSLMVRYWGLKWGSSRFDIYIYDRSYIV